MSLQDTQAWPSPASVCHNSLVQPAPIAPPKTAETLVSRNFSRISSDLLKFRQNLTPCAKQLHEWVLEQGRAGQPQEIYLLEFAESTSNRSRGAYSIYQIRRALKQLLDTPLLNLVYRYSGKVYKLIAHDSRTLSTSPLSPDKAKTLTNREKTINLPPSNPDSAVPDLLKKPDQTNGPHPHPVFNEQGRLGTSDPPPVEDAGTGSGLSHGITPQTLQTIETTLNGPISPQLKNLLFTCTADRIRNALSALQEQLTKGTAIRNPTGWFINALRRGYTANQAKRNARQARQTAQTPQTTLQEPSAPQKPVIPPDLSAWLNLARQLHIAQASEIIDGQLMIHTPTGPIAWSEISQIWSLDRLRGLITAKFTPALPVQPVALPIVGANFDYNDPDLRSSALGRLQMKFKNAVTRDAAIAECDRWGFEIGRDGPQEVDF
jgi:hypothetical protein